MKSIINSNLHCTKIILVFIVILQGCASTPKRDISVIANEMDQIDWTADIANIEELEKQRRLNLLFEAIKATKPSRRDCNEARSLECLRAILYPVMPYLERIYRLSNSEEEKNIEFRYHIHVGQNGRVLVCRLWDTNIKSDYLNKQLQKACESFRFTPGRPHIMYYVPIRFGDPQAQIPEQSPQSYQKDSADKPTDIVD